MGMVREGRCWFLLKRNTYHWKMCEPRNNSIVEQNKVEMIFSPKQSDPLNSSGDEKLLIFSSVLLDSVEDSVTE
jgi:hypothetical protein